MCMGLAVNADMLWGERNPGEGYFIETKSSCSVKEKKQIFNGVVNNALVEKKPSEEIAH